MQTSLNVTSLDGSNKKSTKSITYINPNATNAELKTLAQKFNAISTNEYQDAERIDRQSVEETSPTKQEPTLEVTLSAEQLTGGWGFNGEITYDGDGKLSANPIMTNTSSQNGLFTNVYDYGNGEYNLNAMLYSGGYHSTSFQIELSASEGTNYSAKTVTVNASIN